LIFDVLATRKDGIGRDELIKLLRKETGKDVKHTSYDLSIVLSAKDSPTGMRHRSARDGYAPIISQYRLVTESVPGYPAQIMVEKG